MVEPRTPEREVGGSIPTLYLRRIVSLSKDTFIPLKVLVIPRKRWLRPNMTEKLFTGTYTLSCVYTITNLLRVRLPYGDI